MKSIISVLALWLNLIAIIPGVVANGIDPEQLTKLENILQQYKSIAKEGGWGHINLSQIIITKGQRSEHIPAIRKRLIKSGDLKMIKVPSDSLKYDEDLFQAVKTFQKRHDLQSDGIIGRQTVEAMNVPVDLRIDHIETSLKYYKQIFSDDVSKKVVVNIPEFKARAYTGLKQEIEMKVIVGEEFNTETPAFNDSISYLEFNPYWNVPRKMAQRNFLASLKEDTSWLNNSNYELVERYDADTSLAPSEENIARFEAGEIYLRQKPGPNNEMGNIKFLFPNEHYIYLHDTPHTHLFEKETRTFSNGCIRVEKPRELAKFLLKDNDERWGMHRIDQEIENGETLKVYLKNKIPIYIIYATTYVDEDGLVHFKKDIYGKEGLARN